MGQADADRQLLDRFRDDAPGAFEEFVDRYGSRIVAFGMRVCGEPEDAKDVAQETLLRAYRSLGDVKEPAALRSWIFRVVSNFCLMRRRKGKFEPQRELTLDELMPGDRQAAEVALPDAARMPDDEVARGEIHDAVHSGIQQLPPEYRTVLLLRDIEQLTTRETATALDISEGTVKIRLHRARLMLRKLLVDRFGESPGDGR